MSILYSHIEAVNKCGCNTGFLSRKFPTLVAWFFSFIKYILAECLWNVFFFCSFTFLFHDLPSLILFFFLLCHFILYFFLPFFSTKRSRRKDLLWFLSSPLSMWALESHLLLKINFVLPSCGELRYSASQINADFWIIELPTNAQP